MQVFPLKALLLKFFLGIILILFSVSTYAEDLFSEPTLRAGFYARAFPDFSYEDIEFSVKLLSEEIGKEAGVQTIVTVFDDLALMRKEFERGKINFVVASSLNLANYFDDSLFSDGFRLKAANEHTDNLIVLTRKDSGMDDFKALQGKNLALIENEPIAELYIDVLAMKNFNKNYKNSFKEVKRERKSQQIILKLFFGQADVVCVYYNSYLFASELNPQLNEKIQIIAELNNVPKGAGFFHKNTPFEFRELVISKVHNLEEKERGRQLLQLFKADKAIRATPADLAGVIKLYADFQKLQKNK